MAMPAITPFTLKLRELQRRQAIADALQQESMTPLSGQSTGGAYPVYVKPTALQGLAKLASAYASNRVNADADKKYADIADQMMAAQRQAIRDIAGRAPTPAPIAAPASAGAPAGAAPQPNLLPPLITKPGYTPPPTDMGPSTQPPSVQSSAEAPAGQPGLEQQLAAYQNASMYGVDSEVIKIAAAAQAPTPEMRNIAAVYGQGNPEYRAALERSVNPAVATQPNAPLARFNPQTGQYETAYAAPNMEKGIKPIVQNGQITGVESLPGSADVAAIMSAAQEAGKVSQTPVWQPGERGQPTEVYARPPMMRTARLGDIGSGQPPLQTTAGKSSQEALGRNAADYAQALNDKAAAAVQGKQTLSEMSGLMQGFTPGAGAPMLAKIGAVAQYLGVAPETVQKLTDINPGDAEAFQKGTAALATEAAKQVSNRVTQMEFKTFLANNPNWAMTPNGAKRVMDFMNKAFDQQIAQQQEFTVWSKTHPAESWTTDFPAYWNQKQLGRISRGETRSSPAALTGTETSRDISKSAGTATPISSKADYDKLPRGAKFVGPDGIPYRKP